MVMENEKIADKGVEQGISLAGISSILHHLIIS